MSVCHRVSPYGAEVLESQVRAGVGGSPAIEIDGLDETKNIERRKLVDTCCTFIVVLSSSSLSNHAVVRLDGKVYQQITYKSKRTEIQGHREQYA